MLALTSALATFSAASSASASAVNDRAMSAILASFTADAATMPLHWIYDTKKVRELVGDGSPEFYHTPSCPFYKYQIGEDTPYGQQSRAYLAALANAPKSGKISLDPDLLMNTYEAYYGPGGPCYSTILNATKPGACYHDKSTKEFLDNMKAKKTWPACGGNDTQANGITHMPIVVAHFASEGLAKVLKEVETIVRVTQNTDDAVAFARACARILHKAIMGQSGFEAVTNTITEMKDPNRDSPMKEDAFLVDGLDKVMTELDKPSFDIVQQVGQACDYPYNLWSGAHLIAQNPGYVNGTRQRIMAGGDCGSANMFNGAVFGAIYGKESIPNEWKKKYTHFKEVEENAAAWLKNAE